MIYLLEWWCSIVHSLYVQIARGYTLRSTNYKEYLYPELCVCVRCEVSKASRMLGDVFFPLTWSRIFMYSIFLVPVVEAEHVCCAQVTQERPWIGRLTVDWTKISGDPGQRESPLAARTQQGLCCQSLMERSKRCLFTTLRCLTWCMSKRKPFFCSISKALALSVPCKFLMG